MKKIFFGIGLSALLIGVGVFAFQSQLQTSVFANEAVTESNPFVPPAGCGCTSKSECVQQGCAALQETAKPKSCGCKK